RDRTRRVVPAEALAAIGGVTGALARHADGVIARMRPDERVAARRLLGHLVTPEGLRLRRAEAELVNPGDGAAARALDALVRGRLVLAREEGAREIAHEALVSGWGTLRDWLAGDGERRAARQRLEQAASEWAHLGRGQDGLWSARRIDAIEDLEALDPGERERA